MKYILITLLALNCMGCGSKQIMLADETFENPYMSFKTPVMGWYNYDKKWRKAWDNNGYHISILHKIPANGSLEVRVMAIPTEDDDYFNSDLDFENLYVKLKNSPRSVKMIRQQGISLYEYQTQYFQGIRCVGSVSSRSYGGSLYSASSKNYGLNCGYYHKTAGKRMLRLDYRYYGAVGDSRLQEDSHIALGDLPTLNEAEAVLKSDLVEVLNSIQLKDVDWERMEKEGLIYNKPFNTIKW